MPSWSGSGQSTVSGLYVAAFEQKGKSGGGGKRGEEREKTREKEKERE